MPPIVWVGGIAFLTPNTTSQTYKPSDTQTAAPPPREEPPLIYTARLCASMPCPHWDSNPEHKDFKSSVSANWTMRAHPAYVGAQTPIIPRKRTEPKQKHISNSSPHPAVASLMQKRWWATKLDSLQAPRRKNGRCRRLRSSTPPIALSQVRYLMEIDP